MLASYNVACKRVSSYTGFETVYCVGVSRQIAEPSSVVHDILTELRVFVRACVGKRAVALLRKGCTRALMHMILSILLCNTCSISGACCGVYVVEPVTRERFHETGRLFVIERQ